MSIYNLRVREDEEERVNLQCRRILDARIRRYLGFGTCGGSGRGNIVLVRRPRRLRGTGGSGDENGESRIKTMHFLIQQSLQ